MHRWGTSLGIPPGFPRVQGVLSSPIPLPARLAWRGALLALRSGHGSALTSFFLIGFITRYASSPGSIGEAARSILEARQLPGTSRKRSGSSRKHPGEIRVGYLACFAFRNDRGGSTLGGSAEHRRHRSGWGSADLRLVRWALGRPMEFWGNLEVRAVKVGVWGFGGV